MVFRIYPLEKFTDIAQIVQNGIIMMKFETVWIDFLSNHSTAVVFMIAETP